jgi:hypothetical protein
VSETASAASRFWFSLLQSTHQTPVVTMSKNQVTVAVMAPGKYRGECFQSWGEAMHPAQYLMKKTAFATLRLVFPLMFDALRLSSIDHGAMMRDA